MIVRFGAVAAIALIASSANAQQQPQAIGEQVLMLGCVAAGIERGCLVIKDRASGKTYQISAARPRPNPTQRLVVVLTGNVTDKADTCQQGPVLENITWAYTKMVCDASESPPGGGGKKDSPRKSKKKSEKKAD